MSAPRSGVGEAIRVRTTERGLPVELVLTSEAISMPPERLAREILLRCQVSAGRAQLLRRQRLVADGVGSVVADGLGLTTSAQLAAVEARLDRTDEGTTDDDDLPATWLRRR